LKNSNVFSRLPKCSNVDFCGKGKDSNIVVDALFIYQHNIRQFMIMKNSAENFKQVCQVFQGPFSNIVGKASSLRPSVPLSQLANIMQHSDRAYRCSGLVDTSYTYSVGLNTV
jgi:hypothetical protein